MTSFVSRLAVAAVGLPIVLGAVHLGQWWLFAVAAAGATIALHEFWLLTVILALSLALSLATDSFLTVQNLFDLLTSNAFVGDPVQAIRDRLRQLVDKAGNIQSPKVESNPRRPDQFDLRAGRLPRTR